MRPVDSCNFDLKRYGAITVKQKIRLWLKVPQVRFIVTLRKASKYKKYTIKGMFFRILHRHYSLRYGFQIPVTTQIGKGLYLGHWGTIVINPKAVIGDNCNIAHGVTIGQTNRGPKQGVPIIGDFVWIGSNAVIVGGIRIGNNVLIAPNAYVNIDVPDNSIVIGNPATIIYKEYATKGYINHIV